MPKMHEALSFIPGMRGKDRKQMERKRKKKVKKGFIGKTIEVYSSYRMLCISTGLRNKYARLSQNLQSKKQSRSIKNVTI